MISFLFFLINLFILFHFYFWLCWVFIAAHGLSLVAASGGYSLLWYAGLPLPWPHPLQSTGSRAQAQQLWRTGPVAPRHVGSSRARDRTRVPCTGRQTPNPCATREALDCEPFEDMHCFLFIFVFPVTQDIYVLKKKKIILTILSLLFVFFLPPHPAPRGDSYHV